MFSTTNSMFLLVASLVLAMTCSGENIITLKSIDGVDRTVHFTPNAGLESIPSVEVPAGKTVDVTVPQGWIGNYYAVSKGSANKPGMLGEVAFNGWNDLTYFDVSAIVDPSDHDGVAEMWPASGEKPTSGCKVFPCNNAYYLPDDVQTKTTSETHIITTLGRDNNATVPATPATNGTKTPVANSKEKCNVKRSFVEGKW